MKPRIVILGGGFGGVFAAREICRQLGDKVEIELINDKNYFVFQPLLPEVAGGSITALHAVSPLRFLLKGVRIRKAIVDSVDFDAKVVTVFQGLQRRPTHVSYDHLIVALGQKVDLSRMPGLTEHALTMKTLDDARRLREHIIERLEHAEITQLPDVKKGLLTFTVIGAGFSGIETVGEVKELIDRSLKYYPNIDPAEVRVIVVEFADRVLGELPASLGEYAAKKLRARGIEIMLGTGVKSATGTQLFTSGGDVIETRTIVATIGNAPSQLIRDMGLELEHGRIAVDRTLRASGHQDVWSLGDCALIPLVDAPSERGDYAPPTAQFAVREARHLARNVAASLKGKSVTPFRYESKGALASLGARRGVAEVFGLRLSGYAAWAMWRAYYVAFIPGAATKLRVLINWVLDALAPRSVVQLSTHTTPGIRQALYSAGDRIYESGNRPDGVYTVVSGAVQLDGIDPDTGERITRKITAGGHFGDRMLLGEKRRHSTAMALEDTRVLVMGKDEVEFITDGFTEIRIHLLRHIDERPGTEPWTDENKSQG